MKKCKEMWQKSRRCALSCDSRYLYSCKLLVVPVALRAFVMTIRFRFPIFHFLFQRSLLKRNIFLLTINLTKFLVKNLFMKSEFIYVFNSSVRQAWICETMRTAIMYFYSKKWLFTPQ